MFSKSICCSLLLAVIILVVPCSAQSGTPVPATFFAVSPWKPADFPNVSFGSIAHPQFTWPAVEKARGQFDFTLLDGYIADAQQRGLIDPATNTVPMALTLGLTPSWALNDQSSCRLPAGPGLQQCTAPPDDLQDWTDFVTAVVQHFNGVTAPHVKYYELWNEADDTGWWSGGTAKLVQMGQIAYGIVHEDPYSMLLTPSVTGPLDRMTTWMSAYLAAGGAAYADGGAFHGYLGGGSFPEDDSGYGSIVTKANAMRAVYDANGLAGKPMFQTEGSWGNANVTDPDQQVAWLSRYFLLQAGMRSALNFQMASWFAWDGPDGWGTIETSPGSGQPTPAGLAYTQVFTWVVGARMDQPCSSTTDGTWTCSLSRSLGYSAIAVWNTQGAASYPTGDSTQFRCLDGAACLGGSISPAPSSGSIAIGIKPILLETPARACPLYDTTRAARSGSTVPITVQLCDASGSDLSSADVVLHTIGITQVATGNSFAAQDSGNANPAGNFRFDNTVGSSGGYIFNLSTKGLTTGAYSLDFHTVTHDAIVDAVVYHARFVVK